MTAQDDGGPDGPSVLDFLPQSMRTKLTMERLALIRAAAKATQQRDKLLAMVERQDAIIKRYRTWTRYPNVKHEAGEEREWLSDIDPVATAAIEDARRLVEECHNG